MERCFTSYLFTRFQDMSSNDANEDAKRIIKTLCLLTDTIQAAKIHVMWTDEILEFRYGENYAEMYDEILGLTNLLILDISDFIRIK